MKGILVEPFHISENEDQITVKEVLKAIGRQPLFGHTTGRSGKTMWMCFMKLPATF